MSIEEYVDALSQPRFTSMFNPWGERCDTDAVHNAPEERQERLLEHLKISDPKLILCGEAASRVGCRYVGIPFSSEKLILQNSIPRLTNRFGQRITNYKNPLSEQSATIIWKALYENDIAEDVVLTNCVPWHPFKGIDFANRTPSIEERKCSLPFLEHFISLYPNAKIGAVGKIAYANLVELGIDCTLLRHPANGGSTKLRQGLKELVSRIRLNSDA